LIVFSFVSERKRQVVIEQTRFLSTVFLCSEFKLENISLWGKFLQKKMFAVIFICGNLFLRIAGKIAKIRTRKNFAPHGIPCRPSKLINQDFLLPFKKSIQLRACVILYLRVNSILKVENFIMGHTHRTGFTQ